MITSYSKPAKDFESECSRFIAVEGFNRFMDVIIGFVESADENRIWNAGLRVSMHRMSRALNKLVKEEERLERDSANATIPR